jgi:CRP-like cAMP-binding protein
MAEGGSAVLFFFEEKFRHMSISVAEKLVAFFTRQPGMGADAAAFAARWQTPRSLKRGDYLCQPGKVEQHLWFIASGVLRLYYPTGDEEICVGFAYENNVVCSFPSFVRQRPSDFSIQALGAVQALGIGRAAFYEAAATWPAVAKFWSTSLEQTLAGIIEREIEVSTTSPETRYRQLLERAPHLFQLVPLKYIASYLRIKPETLSRIRGK